MGVLSIKFAQNTEKSYVFQWTTPQMQGKYSQHIWENSHET